MTAHSSQLREESPTTRKVIAKLWKEDACERDLFIRLRPVDRLAPHRLLGDMVRIG
jgi:hypothetical protein